MATDDTKMAKNNCETPLETYRFLHFVFIIFPSEKKKTSLILFEISIHQNKGETTNIVVSRLLFSFNNEQASMSSIHSAFFTRMSYVHKSKLTDNLTKL